MGGITPPVINYVGALNVLLRFPITTLLSPPSKIAIPFSFRTVPLPAVVENIKALALRIPEPLLVLSAKFTLAPGAPVAVAWNTRPSATYHTTSPERTSFLLPKFLTVADRVALDGLFPPKVVCVWKTTALPTLPTGP